MAGDVNFVWNVLKSARRKKWKESRKYFHKFDPWFNQIINGASKEILMNVQTVQTVQAIMTQFHENIRKQKNNFATVEDILQNGFSLTAKQ